MKRLLFVFSCAVCLFVGCQAPKTETKEPVVQQQPVTLEQIKKSEYWHVIIKPIGDPEDKWGARMVVYTGPGSASFTGWELLPGKTLSPEDMPPSKPVVKKPIEKKDEKRETPEKKPESKPESPPTEKK